MEASLAVIGLLLAVIAFQQYSIHKLVNKLMSRNFHEYETAVNLNKEQVATTNRGIDIMSPEEAEDIRSLQGIMPF